jgi:hypothetical protein
MISSQRERGTQGRLTDHDLLEAALKHWYAQRAVKMQAACNQIRVAPRRQLLPKPDAFLRRGQRQISFGRCVWTREGIARRLFGPGKPQQ